MTYFEGRDSFGFYSEEVIPNLIRVGDLPRIEASVATPFEISAERYTRRMEQLDKIEAVVKIAHGLFQVTTGVALVLPDGYFGPVDEVAGLILLLKGSRTVFKEAGTILSDFEK